MGLLTDYERNMAWLEDADHRADYNGQWVVLNAGKLIAHGWNYVALYRKYGNLVNNNNLIVRVRDDARADSDI